MFSVDQEQGKVAHVNFVAEDAKAKGLDGREWANSISEILGGKVSISHSLCDLDVEYRDRLEESKMALRVLEFTSIRSRTR